MQKFNKDTNQFELYIEDNTINNISKTLQAQGIEHSINNEGLFIDDKYIIDIKNKTSINVKQ